LLQSLLLLVAVLLLLLATAAGDAELSTLRSPLRTRARASSMSALLAD